MPAEREIGPSSAPAAHCLFVSERWTSAIEKTYGLKFYRGDSSGAEVFAHISDALGERSVAPAFGDYAERKPLPGLADRIERARQSFPAASYTVKIAGELGNPGGALLRDAVLQELDPQTSEPDANFRKMVRQAERAGLSTRRRTDRDALADFYGIYAAQRISRFRALPQPRSFFQALFDTYVKSGKGWFIEAVTHDRVASSAFVLEHDNVVYYKFGASVPHYLPKRPVNLLMQSLIAFARERGAARLDLGLSPKGGGLARFKRGMGAAEMPLRTYRFDPLEGTSHHTGRDVSAAREILSEVTGALVEADLGEDALSSISARLYRYFA